MRTVPTRWGRLTLTKLRKVSARHLRTLIEPSIVYADGKPVAALVPYERFMLDQKQLDIADSFLRPSLGCRCPAGKCYVHPSQTTCSLRPK